MPLTASEAIIRCMPLVWKWPSLLCQRSACERSLNELTSGLASAKAACNLYKPLLFSLTTKASTL